MAEKCKRGMLTFIPRDRFISVDEVCSMVGLSRSTIWRLIKSEEFPTGRLISPRSRRWRESEVMAWMEERRDN